MAEEFKNLVDMFQRATERYKDNRLFGVKKDGAYRWTTYAEMRKRVENFRAGLKELGVEKGDVVAIIADNCIEWAVAAHASYGLGACFTAMYEKQNKDDWKYIINDCKAKVVIARNAKIASTILGMKSAMSSVEHVLSIEGSEGQSFESVEKSGEGKTVEPIDPAKDDLAVLIYTSGTTGNPKGVRLSHENLTSNVNAVQQMFPIEEGDCSLSFLPWAHSFGQTCELNCLLSRGASMGLAESVEKLVQNLSEVRPTLLFSVPRIFNKLYAKVLAIMEESAFKKALFNKGLALANRKREQGSLGLIAGIQFKLIDRIAFQKVRDFLGGRLNYAFSGGAAISKEVATFIDNIGITVFEGYGLSETSPIACANRPGVQRIGTVGKAIPGVRIELDKSQTGEDSDEGEIVVIGPNVMLGYLNLPDKTAEVIREDGGFKTGDLGRIDSEGYVSITGRLKEQYKLENGKYVVPAPLEEGYKLSPLINQVMVHGANKLYNVALVIPEEETFMAWAKGQGLSGSFAEVCQKDEARKRIQQELDKYGAEFKGYERAKKCILSHEEFSQDNDMLTPTMKLKRRNVMKVWEEKLDALYDGDK